VATFLLTCLPDAARIADQVRRTRVSTVQICDRPEPGTAAALHRALPALKVVQVVHVTGPGSVDEAVEAAQDADAILLDSGNPAARGEGAGRHGPPARLGAQRGDRRARFAARSSWPAA
jgi:phosphoribosylanthranilate isomerase